MIQENQGPLSDQEMQKVLTRKCKWNIKKSWRLHYKAETKTNIRHETETEKYTAEIYPAEIDYKPMDIERDIDHS